VAARAQNPHAEGDTKSSDLAPDSARADKWPISAMVECARSPIDRCAVQSFRKVQSAKCKVPATAGSVSFAIASPSGSAVPQV
jgi:hypothetical protein